MRQYQWPKYMKLCMRVPLSGRGNRVQKDSSDEDVTVRSPLADADEYKVQDGS
jgi:hypothetical protein